jgi:hypothetical protein
MTRPEAMLGRDVEMVYATEGVYGTGKVIGYDAAPTFIVELPNGTRTSWRADLTRLTVPVKLPETRTLGWARVANAEPALGVWQSHESTVVFSEHLPTIYLMQMECELVAADVVEFTPATAVPLAEYDAVLAAVGLDKSSSDLYDAVIHMINATQKRQS